MKDSKPDFSTLMILGPRETAGKENWPSLPVVVWVTLLVDRSVRVTAALGMTAPEESTTLPVIAWFFMALCALQSMLIERRQHTTRR